MQSFVRAINAGRFIILDPNAPSLELRMSPLIFFVVDDQQSDKIFIYNGCFTDLLNFLRFCPL